MRFITREHRWDMMCPVCFYLKPDCLCVISTKVANDNQSGNHALFDIACQIAAKALGLPPEGLFLS